MIFQLWTNIQIAGFPATEKEALDRVRKSPTPTEGFAFIGEATGVKYAVLTDPCNFVEVGDEFSRKPYAIAVQKGSYLKDMLSESILKLLNQRKLELLKEKWWTNNPKRKVI